ELRRFRLGAELPPRPGVRRLARHPGGGCRRAHDRPRAPGAVGRSHLLWRGVAEAGVALASGMQLPAVIVIAAITPATPYRLLLAVLDQRRPRPRPGLRPL